MDRHYRLPPFSPSAFHSRFFDDFDFDRPFYRPYWLDQTMMRSHKIGEGIDVRDDEKEYAVSVDVSQFEPEELKVCLNSIRSLLRHIENVCTADLICCVIFAFIFKKTSTLKVTQRFVTYLR
ncbi:hypothetical protein DICVIV_01666 [Dictyocaulus viviparus]|uniref:SHSP domain-containing protein n=1 Tax=Dictyocaulus viviparus TaxID=29172 RepID=A0A0D8YCB4_DICVI|nr:hypothetical protein DICVIV_01666 [Dictyocaulus viviparus]